MNTVRLSRSVILTALTVAVSLWCVAIISAPLLKSGYAALADSLYDFFGHICHQSEARSFHIAGFPLAVCARCSGIYFGFLAGIVVLIAVQKSPRNKVPARSVLIAALAPMALDVICTLAGVYESAAEIRACTGLLAGFAGVFFVVPPFIESLGVLSNANRLR